jgi:hypothetical protein
MKDDLIFLAFLLLSAGLTVITMLVSFAIGIKICTLIFP